MRGGCEQSTEARNSASLPPPCPSTCLVHRVLHLARQLLQLPLALQVQV